MQTTASSTAEDGPIDWLGYQQYADALWARVVHGFAQESARNAERRNDAPAGDPMVVGVYGEWGVGKSRLLELTYAMAASQSAQDCAQRALDPDAYESTQALRLTVPVWFHPWKYEHEEHLAVPLLMHVADAVRATLKDSRSLGERTQALIQTRGTALKKSAQEIADAVEKGSALVQRVAKAAHGVASNDLVKTATSVAAGFFGLAPAADKSLAWVAETSKRLAGEDDAADAKNTPDAKAEGEKDATPPDNRPTHSVDGRYYYNVQKYLRELAHITPEKALEHDVTLKHEVHLNFVVFVDDLDRCLPEKAVEVLEVIKTVLNIECFAFLVALDDEVIERGISHRYRDYRFVGAKPEMPITGFEYLEKIVHLPFRLPQLTRAQARQFVLHREKQLLTPGVPRLWFIETESDPAQAAGLAPSPLLDILLDSFEAYVPRKLARTMELMHQFQQVFLARRVTLQGVVMAPAAAGPQVDARLVLFCALMQLFAPEVFRLLRRRPGVFSQWMRANLRENSSTPAVFEWQKSGHHDPLVIEVSDADLYRWAAIGSKAATPSPPAPPTPAAAPAGTPLALPVDGERPSWAKYLADAAFNQSDRHSVEQLRLPFATAICEFRDTQRHAFSPLRLGATMAYTMGWTYGSPFSLRGYMQLFADLEPLPAEADAMPQPSAPPAASAPVAPPPPSAGAATPRTPRSVSIRDMLEIVVSTDAATRASLVERLRLQPGDLLDAAAVDALASALLSDQAGNAAHYLAALAALAPHLDATVVATRPEAWAKLPAWQFPPVTDPSGRRLSIEQQADQVLDLAHPYAQVHTHGLTAALGLQTTIPQVGAALSGLLNSAIDPPRQMRATELNNLLAGQVPMPQSAAA